MTDLGLRATDFGQKQPVSDVWPKPVVRSPKPEGSVP